MNKKAVILVSGGVDSSTVSAMIKKAGFDIYALSFNYAQNHVIELNKIRQFIVQYNVKEHRIIKLDLSAFSSSALVAGIHLPGSEAEAQIRNGGVESTKAIFSLPTIEPYLT